MDQPAERWEGAEAAALAAAWGVPAVHLWACAGSTNDLARGLAERGAPAWSVVLADEQRAGRGRGGKGWSSPPGVGVWMSLVLRPPEGANPALLPLLVGIAAAEALDGFVRPAAVQLKWPNDLLLAGRKLGGILCEGSWEAGKGYVVAGIGINVLHLPGDFPPELRGHATSLRTASGWAPARAEVAGAVVQALRRTLAAPPATLPGAQLEALRARDALFGRRVRVSGAEVLTGTCLGIGAGGELLLRTAQGALRSVRSGTVRLEEGALSVEAASPG